MSTRLPPLVIGEHHGPRGRQLAAFRRSRRPRRRLWLGLGAGLVLVGLLAYGGYWLLTSPLFAVKRIESGPYRFSSRDEVEAALGGCLGRNIWTLSRRHVAAACSTLPWVRDVRLERRIPDTLLVALGEWSPLLAVGDPSLSAGATMLVGDGSVLALPERLDAPILPLLVGGRLEEDGPGRWRLVAPDPHALLELVAAIAATGLESTHAVDFVRATRDGFVLDLQGRTGSLLLGNEDFQARLARYLMARPQIPVGAVVDLRFADRVTIVPPPPDST
jgi:cell division septal protein FtsQ